MIYHTDGFGCLGHPKTKVFEVQRVPKLESGEELSVWDLMTIDFRPLHDRVIVNRVDEGELVRGSKLMPETSKNKSQDGKVIVTGNAGVLACTDTNRLFGGTGAGEDTLDPRQMEGEELLNIREDARNDHARGRGC